MIEAVFAVNCRICCLGLHVTYLVNTAILLQLSKYYLLNCSSIAVPIGHSLNLNDLVFNATVPLSTWTQLCYQCSVAVLQSPLTLYLIPEHRTMHTGSVFFFIKCWPYTTNIHCIELLIFFFIKGSHESICVFLLLLQEDMYFLKLELDPSWCTVHWQLPLKRTGSGGMKVLSLGHLIKSCSFHFSLSCLLPPNCHPPFFSPQCMDHPKMITRDKIWHSRNINVWTFVLPPKNRSNCSS